MAKGDTTENLHGKVKISSDAIASIAAIAAQKIPGVAGINKGIINSFREAIGLKKENAGVEVLISDGDVYLTLLLNIKYGSDVPDTALKVQEKVRETVENMTNLAVREINVSVRGISNT